MNPPPSPIAGNVAIAGPYNQLAITPRRQLENRADLPVADIPIAEGKFPHEGRRHRRWRSAQSAQLIHNYGDVIATFVGWDSLLLSALAEGAAGVMAGTANVVPTELVAVYDAVNAGNLEQARQAWARIYPLIDAIMAHPFIPAVRAGLEAVGFPIGSPRPPVAKLDAAAAAHIAELAAAVRSVPAS